MSEHGTAPKPRCILLTGHLGAGKSTISAKYGADHPLSLMVHTDELMGMVGRWTEHEDEALKMTFAYALDMARSHLRSGHDVILPYFVHTVEEIRAIETIAKETGADFHTFLLNIPKELSVERMLARGSWGEPGSPPITEADIPIIEAKYDELRAAVADYPKLHHIDTTTMTSEESYDRLLSCL